MKTNNDYYHNHLSDKKERDSMRMCILSMSGIILIVLFSLLLSSCESTQYIPVEKTKTEYISRTDTIRQIDSVFSEKETIIREADSNLVAKLGLQLKANEKAILVLQRELDRQVRKESEHKTDTVIKTDSIQIPYPVERKLTKWEQAKIETGGIAIGSCLGFVILVIVFFIAKVLRKT